VNGTEEKRRKAQSSNAVAENMRAKEASKYLACGVSTLWLWVQQKKIKAYKLSDRVTIFKRSELDAFVNASSEVA
jgi:excisionase family DNA binding protein